MFKFKCNINFFLCVLMINISIITLLRLSLYFKNASYVWFSSILLLNIQTFLTTSIISFPFYSYHKIYRFYLTSVIITSILSGFLFLLYISKYHLDISIILIIIYLGLLVNIFDLVVFKTIYEITYRNNDFIKKKV